MEFTIKSRNGKISERQREHIEEKLAKLGRYLNGITSITVEVQHEQQRNVGEVYRVQTTLVAEHGVILRAEERAADLYAAIDAVQEVLQRQIQRYKDKYWRRSRELRRATNGLTPAEEVAIAEAETEAMTAPVETEPVAKVIRTKTFRLRPMFVDDAIEQMELLGHTFFVFQDAETMQISVLYRRRDGNYGVIVPEVG
ncbi:ribosome hibernation-promoting factor, HPF/YfiA family [Chloroflexus aggregans]|uniref:Ribosome hibernation promoting factor n=1 Tax=Chloroflexus aggregans (strain MD-66 / DSM 9485) TaxID=326427 RepID=B8GDB0_CHLAD|nr:ribosome-associated translation inhibitor RaiA [Chloroflexus aggregans]ACL25177.1 sigma 54 modulation protein/ribosomal protein S30EA [Chloroflexus aggregans DSM 9485]